MPLPNQTNFQWRPNDNGPITSMRYDIEAEKWVDSVSRAQNRIPKENFSSDLGFMGALLTIPLCLLIFIILIPIKLIRELIGYNIKLLPAGWINRDRMEVFHEEIAELKRKYPSPKKKKRKTWDELTPEEQQLVQISRASTAKAKKDWDGVPDPMKNIHL